MKHLLRRVFQSETVISILFISLITIVTHGLFLSKLGYYYDDWYVLWSGAARGANSLVGLFSTDRPFMGVVYSALYRVFGDAIMAWQLYALLWRLIGGLAFFWILRLVWPKQKFISTAMAALFIVYPGFLSQPDANTKQNHLYAFGTALLSIALMLQGLKTGSKVWKYVCLMFSLVLTANYLWIYEYMIGLELMRLLLLGVTLYQDGLTRARDLLIGMIKRWWSYPIVLGIFLTWRLFIFDSSRSATNTDNLAFSYRSNLVEMLLRLVFQTIKDFFTTTVFAWVEQTYQLFSRGSYTDLFIGFVVGGLAVGLFIGYLKWLENQSKTGESAGGAENAGIIRLFLALGVLITLGAIFPVVLAGRWIDLGDAYKSYGLHPLPGVMLIAAGFILMLKPDYRKVVLMALIWLSVSTQTLNILSWANIWRVEKQTWWQLSWRAPDIKNNTLVMAFMRDEFTYQQDYETWGPVNLIYRPGKAKFPAIQSEVLNNDTSLDVLTGNVRDRYVRDIWLHRDFSKLLLISLPTRASCVHIIDGKMPAYSAGERQLVEQVGSYSRIDRIVSGGSSPTPPAAIFGAEPAHGWCYYYQKASLARQAGLWAEVGKLYDESAARKLVPADNSEFFPFLEGLVNLGRVEDARKLYEKYVLPDKPLNFSLCSSLSSNPGYPAEFMYDYEGIQQLVCGKK